ncbi:hypothetical protein P12x_002746 [Tundrisphaera lichenicola]|uniref:hypothetical protein n=1 Tax=Tundrisphaera lichenicola TaxID=2029860 RepID=UPI003EB7EA13
MRPSATLDLIPSASLDHYPIGRPLTADQITEFHAARILLLISLCGTKDKVTKTNKIDGLTKLAKLDFFIRYPDFYRRAKIHLHKEVERARLAAMESPMVRHHYGPWDPRYYQILAYLESRVLITVGKVNRAFVFLLTEAGQGIAQRLAEDDSYFELCDRMTDVRETFKGKSGDWLKRLVYQIFDEEIANLPLGRMIES